MMVAALGVMGPATAFAFGGPEMALEAPAGPIHAQPATSAEAEVIILYGSNDNTGIDPQLGKMPELSKPPFSSFNSYKLLDRKSLTLVKGAAQNIALPTSSTLAVTLKDVTTNKSNETRYDVTESITNGDKSILPELEVSAKRTEFFFVAGEKYKDGALVIGTRIK